MRTKSDKEIQFMAMYAPAHAKFERFCKARVYGEIDYKDLMHDTILIAYEKFAAVESEKAFLYFLFGICIRVLANANKKQRPLSLKQDLSELHLEDQTHRMDRKDDVDMLYHAMAQLPEAQKEALVLFEISGFSIVEISDLQKASISAVKQRLARGRQELLRILTLESAKRKESIL